MLRVCLIVTGMRTTLCFTISPTSCRPEAAISRDLSTTSESSVPPA